MISRRGRNRVVNQPKLWVHNSLTSSTNIKHQGRGSVRLSWGRKEGRKELDCSSQIPGVGKTQRQRGLQCNLSDWLIPPLVLAHWCCAAVGLGFWFRLKGEALDEAPGEAAGFLPGGRAGAGIGQVIMRLAQACFLLLILPPEDELGAAPEKADFVIL